MSPVHIARRIIAHHLVFTGYGHWLSNDLRGSGSDQTRKDELRDLGPVHTGRKPDHEQPSREELRAFYRAARGRLDHPTLWFNEDDRQAMADALAELVKLHGYTVWACAICSNHAHACVRVHRDDAVKIWDAFANAARLALVRSDAFPDEHPVWASRPYKVFLHTPADVRGRIGYIRKNPLKEGLPEQNWSFIQPYDGWPLRHRRRPN